MKKLVFLTTIMLSMLMAGGSAFAVPMQYEINFDGPAPGTGAFIWDSDTQSLSGVSWSFDAYSGGVNDATFPWESIVGGGNGSLSEFFFEILTMEDSHPLTCTETNTSCGVLIDSSFGYGDFDSAYFQLTAENLRRYSFMIGEEFVAYGIFTTNLVGNASVPAPASLALLGLGLIGLGFSRLNKKDSKHI